MRIQKLTLLAGAAAAVVMAMVANLAAATVTSSGMTLEFPSYPFSPTTQGLLHCEPWNDDTANKVTLSGVPEGSSVTLQFVFSSGVLGSPLVYPAPINLGNQGGTFTVDIPYPQNSLSWPYQNGNVRSIVVGVAVSVTRPDGTRVKFSSKQWKVTCIPDENDEGPFEGCTLGYWKNHTDSWEGFATTDSFDAVFGVTSHIDPPGPGGAYVNPSLLTVLEVGGGDGADGQNGMARQAVAALLNAAHSEVDFPMSEAEVIAAVQAAYAGTRTFASVHAQFEAYNEMTTTLPDGTTYHCGLN
jgi:hypothetical protein